MTLQLYKHQQYDRSKLNILLLLENLGVLTLNCYILFKLKLTETIREIVKWSVLFFITSIQMNKYLSRLDRHREQDSFHPETDRQSCGSRVHFEISELLINNPQSIGKLNIKSSSQLSTEI